MNFADTLFYERFCNICREHNTSPSALLMGLGYANNLATHWKQGSIPKADVLCDIADALSCSVDFLLGRSKSRKQFTISDLSQNQREALAALARLPDREQIKWISKLEDAAAEHERQENKAI